MFWDMAVVLKATQEAPAASAIDSYSLPGTLTKSEILETHGIMTSLGKVQPPIQYLTIGVSQKSIQRLVVWSYNLRKSFEVSKLSRRAG